MDINYELYKVFYYVAVSLSFSEASRKLFISQSAVSQSIKVLEKKLNQPLFIRSTKKVQLTPEGEILLRHIEPAMNLIKRGEMQILETGSLGGGQLRIGASDTICRYFLVPYLSRFHKEYPNIHIKVTNQTSIGCVDLLESGTVDLIFTNYPNSRLGHGCHIQFIKDFHDCFVASRKYYGELEHQTLSLKEKEYVEAARSIGVKKWVIMFRHILPNCIPSLIVLFTLNIPSAILSEASLSFLGVGAQPPSASWGLMVVRGKKYLFSEPWLSIAPSVAIMIVVMAFNFLGDGLRDVLDPYLKEQ